MQAIIDFFNYLSKFFRRTNAVTITANLAAAPRISETRVHGAGTGLAEATYNHEPTEYDNQRTISSNDSIDSDFNEEGVSSPPRQTRAERKLLISAALQLYIDSKRTFQKSKIVAVKQIYQAAILNYIYDLTSFDSIEIQPPQANHRMLLERCPLGISLYTQGRYLEFVVLKVRSTTQAAKCLTLEEFSQLIDKKRTAQFRRSAIIMEASHEEGEDEDNSFSPRGATALALPGAVEHEIPTITDDAVSLHTRSMS